MEKAKGRKRPKSNNFIGMVAIALVALILLGVLLVEGVTLQNRIAVYDAKAESLQDQIDAEHKRTEEIDKTKEYMETDEYTEEVARDKLGLVKDNEIVFQEEE